ncbi:MAG TPA: TetR/AcrR family transcriptional regulator [Solirubrobacteraceae bacterium]|nr:TetR/AcrR family transcriptional regulator [Solirubrobacteraceae bacterium]
MTERIAGGASSSGTTDRPDGRRIRGDRTRRAILLKAVDIASVEGLEGLSIGRLASELGVSKSGLFAHFGAKQELQLETIEMASEIFEEEVWLPVAEFEPGVVRLAALMDSWLAYFRREVFSGGCFFSNAHHEYDSRRGPIHDEIAKQKQRWTDAIVAHIRGAQKRGQLRPDVEPEQLAFELDAAGVLANSLWQLNRDERGFDRASTAIRHRLATAATARGRRALASYTNALDLTRARR